MKRWGGDSRGEEWWGERSMYLRRNKGQITPRLFDNASRNQFILYLPKIIQFMYTYICCLKEVKLLWVDHATHKNHLIRKPQYQT